MKKGLIINEDVWSMIDELEPAEKTELLVALSAYYQGTEIPGISRITGMVFKRIAIDNERFAPENRERISEIRAEAGRKGGSKPKQNKQTEANESKTSKIAQDKIRIDKDKIRIESSRFAPPTAEQVREYCHDSGYSIDAERFINFYESKGWMVGKTKMKDWKAAVRNWATRDGSKHFSTERQTDDVMAKVWEGINARWAEEAAE